MTLHDTFAIVVHEMVYGPPQAFRDYLLQKKAAGVIFFGLPFHQQKNAHLERYEYGQLVKRTIGKHQASFGLMAFIRDFFLIIVKIGSLGDIDQYIGADPLTTCAGLVLRTTGRVRRVILYTMDFTPVRFSNPILNFIFHSMEVVCVRHADEVWNVSPRMAEGRQKFLGLSPRTYKQAFVPVGIWNKKIPKVPYGKTQKYKILFIGHLMEKQGLQCVIEALSKVRALVPQARLLVIGGGEYEANLKALATSLGVSHFITFAGWVHDPKKLYTMMATSAVAVATYKPEVSRLHNFSYFADPGKIKDYLGAGIPIVLTDIPYNAKEIAARKCGIIARYEPGSIAAALTKLLSDEKTLKQYRASARAYAKELDWTIIFDRLITR